MSTTPLDPPGLIDVKALIARYSGAEHAAQADAYFGRMTDGDKVLRKPFFGLRETQANLHGTADVLALLRLFLGARVLDFGAGTGWFSRMLALLECKPIAVDVSALALDLGRRACERDPLMAGLPIEWHAYDGVTLPLADESVDRIVSYDAFHHVADQAGTLREFHRVLVPGGRIAFHEPGPEHSKSPASQYEMRQHQVIENDIIVEDIWALAEPLGFSAFELALSTPQSPIIPLADYNRIIRGDATLKDVASLLQGLAASAPSLRIFAMTKGEAINDSRAGTGLAGEVTMQLTDTTGETIRGRVRVVNTGVAVWRPSIDEAGGVWLGVQQPDAEGQTDAGRIWLSDTPIMPGQAVEVAFSIRAPLTRPTRLSFDLVSEFVVWFQTLGATPVSFLID